MCFLHVHLGNTTAACSVIVKCHLLSWLLLLQFLAVASHKEILYKMS